MRRALGWTGLVAAILLAGPATAQPMGPPPGVGGPPMAGPMGRAKLTPQQRAERRVRMLKRHIGLNDATAKRVVAILAKYDQQRRTIGRGVRDHHKKLVELVKSDSNDQAAYRREILALRQGKVAMQQLRDREFAELQRVLTPKQQAKLLVAMDKLRQRRMMRHRRRVHRGHRGPRRGGRH